MKQHTSKPLNSLLLTTKNKTSLPNAMIPASLFFSGMLSGMLSGLPLLMGANTAVAMVPTVDAVTSATKITATATASATSFTTNVDGGYTTSQALPASLQASYNELLSQAQKQNLAQHPTWLRLLYYPADGTTHPQSKDSQQKQPSSSAASQQSSVVTQDRAEDTGFFLSQSGSTDPQAEMAALLAAMLADGSQNANSPDNSLDTKLDNSRASCRFPARVHWLKQTLGISDALMPEAVCPEFDAWMQEVDPQQLSLIFAEEYTDSMTSAFAHTLVRVDSTASLNDPSQLGRVHALNYTVDGNPEASRPVYGFNSMTGKYPGIMTVEPYPEKIRFYLAQDERDVWEYPIKLTTEETQQIMRHVWEVKDLGLPYFFMTDNCASEILRLIDVVRPEQTLFSEVTYAAIPSEVVRLLDGQNLLEKGSYLPANNTVRQANINAERAPAKNINDKNTSNKINTHVSEEGVSTASLPFGVGIGHEEEGVTLINQLNQLPKLTPADNNPVEGHPVHRAHVAAGAHGERGYAEVGVRASYHDLLDRPTGYRQFLDLQAGSISVRAYENDKSDDYHGGQDVVLQDLTLIKARTFNPVNSGRKGVTWGGHFRVTQVNDASSKQTEAQADDHLVASVGAEYGKSWAFGTPAVASGQIPPQLCYVMGTGGAQVGKGLNKGYRVGVGANLGCYFKVTNQLRAQAELQLPYWYHGGSNEVMRSSGYWQPQATVGMQYDINRNNALRLNLSQQWYDDAENSEDMQLAYLRYF